MKIEAKVEDPRPRPNNGLNGGRAKYPWGDMSIGDSFFVPPESMPEKSGHRGISARAAMTFGAGNFRTRKENGGVRVWRLA